VGGSASSGRLRVGTAQDGTPAHVLATRLNRHTFWCGQSGSGKTYALGVLLEQVLLRTALPLLVLDPNGDFVRLGEPRPGADPADAGRLRGTDVTVLRSGAPERSLTARFTDLSPQAKAAVLRMDPVLDAEEYHALVTGEGNEGLPPATSPAEVVGALEARGDPASRALALRLENLQVLEWDLWAWGGASATDVVDRRPPATVMAVGGFRHRGEAQVAALAVLEHLWRHKDERRPVLVVIDEAHNICPAAPSTLVEAALAEQVVQIAAEGRKYGLWLLMSTQRPNKVQPNALTQCDNLGLLRVNSTRDLSELEETFGFAPSELLRRSPTFGQGEVLLAGGFVDAAQVVRVGPRLSQEGGSDVAVPLLEGEDQDDGGPAPSGP
jgi:DNA helicase HerA-like ATPase